MYNADKMKQVAYEASLAELKSMDALNVTKNVFNNPSEPKDGGIKAGELDDMAVRFIFKETGQSQNVFQGDSLSLKFTFHAQQEDGNKL